MGSTATLEDRARPVSTLRLAFIVIECLALLDTLPAARWWWPLPIIVGQIGLGLRTRWRFDPQRAGRIAALLAFDVIAFTALLGMAGAASNPFTVGLLVYIAVSVISLPPRYSWALVGLTVGGYAVLFVGHDPHAHHDMGKHLRGMWFGFAATASLMVLFGSRIHRQLVDARARLSRSKQLAALGALAASTAHELGTPLGSIAVATGEMARALEINPCGELADDVALIAGEVRRCRRILDRLAHDVGHARGEGREAVDLVALAHALARIPEAADRVTVVAPDALAVQSFPSSVRRAVQAVLDNALRAGPGPVELRLGRRPDGARIEVVDQGCGMAPEVLAQATDPFFSTRGGDGLGLGLYLAVNIIEQIGGRLVIESTRDQGTRVSIDLPLEAR